MSIGVVKPEYEPLNEVYKFCKCNVLNTKHLRFFITKFKPKFRFNLHSAYQYYSSVFNDYRYLKIELTATTYVGKRGSNRSMIEARALILTRGQVLADKQIKQIVFLDFDAKIEFCTYDIIDGKTIRRICTEQESIDSFS